MDFPWHRLDRRPLVYASLGTLQNGSQDIFHAIAHGCADLPVQLILSLGGGLDPALFGKLPGDPLLVRFAPQLELIKRAAVVITHAGINTALESLAEGVPMVAIPIGNDQPGVAARVHARGAGIVLSRKSISASMVGNAVRLILEDGRYKDAAQRVQAGMSHIDGPALAASIIEQKLALEPTAIPV